jgi:multisubunit Na+/H+ antiporter MnhC subunit
MTIGNATASIDWRTTDDNYSTVNGYNLALINTETTDATYVSLYNSSYTQVVTDGSYRVSISAVDICQQESEPATLEFLVDTSSTTSPCEYNNKGIVDGLIATIVVTFIVVSLAMIVILIMACFCFQRPTATTSYNATTRDKFMNQQSYTTYSSNN